MPTETKSEDNQKDPKEDKKEIKLTFEELVKQEVHKQLKEIKSEFAKEIEEELAEVRRTSQAINGSLGNFDCHQCGKGFMHVMGGYYTNHAGYKFCSDACITRYNNIMQEKDNADTNND